MDIEYATVQSSTDGRKNESQIDEALCKTHYPRDNNDKILSFVLQQEPNLCLDMNSIEICARVKIPKTHWPDNGFSSKLFRNLSIEINSQLITATKCT